MGQIMETHKQIYYNYQTQARGLLDKNVLHQRFEKLAKWYACRLSKYLPANRKADCLDLPCGYGNFLYFLRIQGYQSITGYDFDPEQVRLAQLLNLPAHEGDAFAILSEEGKSYDCISSLDFVEHLSRDDTLCFLELCWACLKPGGVLIIRTACADGPFGAHGRYNDLTHEWAMTSNLLRTVLEMQNFGNVEILDERPQPYKFSNMLRLVLFYGARTLFSGLCYCLGLRPPSVWSRSMWGIGHKPNSTRTRRK